MRTLAVVSLVLGLEYSCPWPREGVFSEGLSLASNFFVSLAPSIAVGGGGAGGAVAPPFGSKRRKSSKIRANGLIIWANSLDIWTHHCQNTVSVSVKTFFFFFLENTFIWTEKPFKFWKRPFFFFFFFFGEHLHLDRKTVQISGKHFNLGRKNRLNFDRETQCIKSCFGQKFAAPPNHFELLRPWPRALCPRLQLC